MSSPETMSETQALEHFIGVVERAENAHRSAIDRVRNGFLRPIFRKVALDKDQADEVIDALSGGIDDATE